MVEHPYGANESATETKLSWFVRRKVKREDWALKLILLLKKCDTFLSGKP